MPSEIIELKNNQILKKKYYAIKKNATYSSHSYSEFKDKIKYSLETSVKKMMIADVEVGCFLSGGIDSSLVAMMMQRNSKKLELLQLVLTKKNTMNPIMHEKLLKL